MNNEKSLEILLDIAVSNKKPVIPFVIEYLNTCKQYLSYNCLDVDYVLKEMKEKYMNVTQEKEKHNTTYIH